MQITYKYKKFIISLDNDKPSPYQWIMPLEFDNFCQIYYFISFTY